MRPTSGQLLADLAIDVIDGMVFYDLDRLVRQPRDLEDLIDVVEYVKRPVIGATGGRMNLINDSDRHMARMRCVMALKSPRTPPGESHACICPSPKRGKSRAASPTAGSARAPARASPLRASCTLPGSPKALTAMCDVAVSAFGGSGECDERERLPLGVVHTLAVRGLRRDQALRARISSVRRGTTSNRSPTTP